jgi:hypothetical protein
MALDRAALEKIAGSKLSGGGNHVRDGEYLFTVKKLFGKQGHKGQSVVLELLVESAKGVGEKNPDGSSVEPNAVGTHCSTTWNITKHDAAAGNVKSFVLAILGLQENQMTEAKYLEILAKVTDDATNPLRGMRVRGVTYRTTIKSGPNANKPFVGMNWEKVTQAKEEVRARRAQLDVSAEDAAAMPQAPAQVAPPPAPVAPPPAPVVAPPAPSALDDLF